MITILAEHDIDRLGQMIFIIGPDDVGCGASLIKLSDQPCERYDHHHRAE